VSRPPFILPALPIDKYEVRYFGVERHLGLAVVREFRCVYHVNSTWAEVCPNEASRNGAPFVNHWQVFTDGQFTGRTSDGWDAILQRGGYGWEEFFATQQEANAYAIEHLRRCIEGYREHIRDAEEQIKQLGGAP